MNKKNREKNSGNIVIVGAGPAGINAAATLADAGVKSIIVDENNKIGGMVYRINLRANGNCNHISRETIKSTYDLQEKFDKNKGLIELRLASQVVGAFSDKNQLAILDSNGFYTLDYDYLIVCTGCYEKALPFPGWTLPGVMTIGGIQLQVKNGLVKAGKSICIVGTGPLLPVVAKQLHAAGANVVGVYETGRKINLIKKFHLLFNNWKLLLEGIDCLMYLKTHGIEFKFGWGLVEARGREELEEVVVAPYDSEWRPLEAKQKVVKADCLGVEYGFQPRIQLTQLLNIKHHHEGEYGLMPVRDSWGRSSKSNIYVAGDTGAINGAIVAEAQGQLAALAVLQDQKILGKKVVVQIEKSARKKAQKNQDFRRAFSLFSKPRVGLLELAKMDTVVCRCENVKLLEIDKAIKQGVKDIVTLKMTTRIGMGDCQGKICATFCTEYLKYRLNKEEVGVLNPRFPLAPINFNDIVKTKENV